MVEKASVIRAVAKLNREAVNNMQAAMNEVISRFAQEAKTGKFPRDECLSCVQALMQKFVEELLETLAYTLVDPFLGVYSRTVFGALAGREVALCRRNDIPLSVLFVDVDNLKEANDNCGHLGGDRLLREIATTIRSNVRTADLVFRWGGDEFVVLLHTTREGAMRVKDRIQGALCQKEIELCEGYVVVPSVSIGVSEVKICEDRLNNEELLLTAIQCADEEMYREKKRKKRRGA